MLNTTMMASSQLTYPALLIVCLLLPFTPIGVDCMPYILLQNRFSKCFFLDNLAPSVSLKIGYHAPDLDVKLNDRQLEEESQMTITITHRIDPARAAEAVAAVAANRQGSSYQTNKRERFPLKDQSGKFYFRTADIPGLVEICAQSHTATNRKPNRIALNITSSEESYRIYQEVGRSSRSKKDGDQVTTSASRREPSRSRRSQRASGEDSADLKRETDRIIGELKRMEYLVKDVYRKIHISQQINSEFQAKSVKLNHAVRYWPIFRIVILLVAGALQVHSVIGYMKRHHIT